jgi:D-threonate/D-erythronate kinase
MIGVVGDDLTGACDSAAPFLRAGAVRVALWPHLEPGPADACFAISTETRGDASEEEARTRTRAAVSRLLERGASLVYKKVDSRLRGHVRPELEGVLEAWPGGVLLAPALPAEGRVTRGGRQLTGLEEVDLRRLVEGLDRVQVADAESDEDLDRLAAAAVAERLLPAGSAGLAAALARRLPEGPRGEPWPPVRRPLVLAGSKTEVTAEQLERAAAAGWEVRRRNRGDEVVLGGCDALFLTGGGTAAGVVAALGAEGLDLLGEALPRVPVGRLRGGPHSGLLVALKSGGFGGPDAIERALARLCEGE